MPPGSYATLLEDDLPADDAPADDLPDDDEPPADEPLPDDEPFRDPEPSAADEPFPDDSFDAEAESPDVFAAAEPLAAFAAGSLAAARLSVR